MGRKYCPECREVVEAKALPDYKQIEYRGIPVKKRRIIHLEEDDGCGHSWYTLEMPEDVLIRERGYAQSSHFRINTK